MNSSDPQLDDAFLCPECGEDVVFNEGRMGLPRSQATCECGWGAE